MKNAQVYWVLWCHYTTKHFAGRWCEMMWDDVRCIWWDVYDVWQTMLFGYDFDTIWWGFTRIRVYHNGHTGGKPWILWTNAGCGGKSRCKWKKLTEIHGENHAIQDTWRLLESIGRRLSAKSWIIFVMRDGICNIMKPSGMKREPDRLYFWLLLLYLYVFFCCSIISHMMLSKQPHVLRWMPQGTPSLFWWNQTWNSAAFRSCVKWALLLHNQFGSISRSQAPL